MDQTLKIHFAKSNDLSRKDITSICDLINRTYEKGEEGLWVANYQRISIEVLENKIQNNQLIIAQEEGLIIGAVLVKKLTNGITGEFGMLAVDIHSKKNGVGGKLIKKVEDWAISNDLNTIQLELLTPSNWKHQTKEFLIKWYTKLGYIPQKKEPIQKAYPELSSLLKTDCDLTIWTKKLTID